MNILFLCIGSEKISGDSLGPMVGTMLKEKYNVPFPVIGTEEHPVNGVNISRYKEHIRKYFPNHKIIAIDAALGEKNDLWEIRFREGGIKAGGAVGTSNTMIGDIGILGVVGEKGTNALQTLLNASFPSVVNLAEKIVEMLLDVFVNKNAN